MLASFTLADQYGADHAVALGDGQPAVLLFADHGSVLDVRPWVERLTGRYDTRVRLVGVAALGVVPTLFHGAVRTLLRPLLDGQPSVLLDWGNAVSDAFGYAGDGCLLVVVDAAGAERVRVHGPCDDGRFARVTAGIDLPAADAAG